jgi:hypothetical protein
MISMNIPPIDMGRIRMPRAAIAAGLGLFMALTASAAALAATTTYYVSKQDPRGNDLNPGTEGLPFYSIQKAADIAMPGDRVVVLAGAHKERVIIRRSGEPGRPIIFEGTRGPDGALVTVIDPGIDVGSGWVPAPEIGETVWKKADIPFNPAEMTVEHKHLLRILNEAMPGAGIGFLALPANAVCDLTYPSRERRKVRCWDGIGAAYGTMDGVTYIRFRHGENPNTKELRAASNGGSESRVREPAVAFDGAAHVVFKGFHIRGGFAQVGLLNGSHHNEIRENLLTTGSMQLTITDGSHDNIVEGNDITLDDYAGVRPGAWASDGSYESAVRQHIYSVAKDLSAQRSTAIYLTKAGDNNRIIRNTIHDSLAGIALDGDPESPYRGTEVAANTVHNMSSVGIVIVCGHTETEIHHNLVYDCNINFRWHQLNEPGEKRRVTYIHHNRSWNPEGRGSHIYCHYWAQFPSTYHPVFWDYHNSYSGGKAVLTVGASGLEKGGVPSAHFVNDIFSGRAVLDVDPEFLDNRALVGSFDHNLLAEIEPSGEPAWMGKHNKRRRRPVWKPDVLPSFEIDKLPEAAVRGLDLSRPFTLQGKNYPALPGATSSGAARFEPDLGAVEKRKVT